MVYDFMHPQPRPSPSVPQIESLHVKNYRALHDLDLKGITPFTVFLGPNGSGKSTIFDVFAFLSECFSAGLRKAWDRRGRFKELRTRGSTGPIEIELGYRESRDSHLITYHLTIDEDKASPFVFSTLRTARAWSSPETSLTKERCEFTRN